MCILTDRDIFRAVTEGNIVISPFDPARVGPNSYDVCLADELLTYKLTNDQGYRRPLDCRIKNETLLHKIPIGGFVLQPGALYLGSTVEYTESPRHAPKINGKSSLGRLGLVVHVTAGEGDVGFRGTWTLEMTVTHPLVIYPGMVVAQLLWSTVTSDPLASYGERCSSKYEGQRGPTASAMHKNFDGDVDLP